MTRKLETFVLFTEDSIETIQDLHDQGFHWHYLKSPTMGWGQFKQMATNIANMDNDQLQKLGKVDGANGSKQFNEVIATLNKFVCDRCNKDFGDTATWGTDKLLAFDGLSGLSRASRSLTVGWKPIMSQPDWGVAMGVIDQLVYTLAHTLNCHMVLISHIEPEKDEVTGGMKNFPSTLGRKLGPSLPQHFKDVVLSQKAGSAFAWTTISSTADTGGRILPLSDKISPDFTEYLKLWETKGGKYIQTIKPGDVSGIKMLLMGPPKTGKTFSLRTIIGLDIPDAPAS